VLLALWSVEKPVVALDMEMSLRGHVCTYWEWEQGWQQNGIVVVGIHELSLGRSRPQQHVPDIREI
jgi:hypothetical protein